MLALSLIIIGILLRFAPHSPNFTPVAAIALFAGAYLKKKHALIIPLLLMAFSDLAIGMHDVVLFTWGSFALITVLGFFQQKKTTAASTILLSFISSILFFIVTNFGVWLLGWYPHTTSGLIQSYVMALPFLRDFALSTLIYAAAFFGSYELIARAVRDRKLAKVLLNKL
jgi:hypothetical protein